MQKCDRCGEQKEKSELEYHNGYSGDKELNRIFYFCKSCTEDWSKIWEKNIGQESAETFQALLVRSLFRKFIHKQPFIFR